MQIVPKINAEALLDRFKWDAVGTKVKEQKLGEQILLGEFLTVRLGEDAVIDVVHPSRERALVPIACIADESVCTWSEGQVLFGVPIGKVVTALTQWLGKVAHFVLFVSRGAQCLDHELVHLNVYFLG